MLLTAWPLLRDTWLTETHADRIVRTRLHNIAAEWARHSRDPSYLYSGSLLQAATETAARIGADPARNPPLGQTERDFLHASDRARRRTARRRHAVIAGLLALTVTAITAAGIAVHNARTHQRRQRRPAACRRRVPPARRRKPQQRSHRPRDGPAARCRRLARLPHRPGLLGHGNHADRATAGRHAARRPSTVNGVAFSPDGKMLASADADGMVRLWDPATGQAVGTPAATAAPVTACRRERGGVQPGWQDAGQRRRRRHGPAMEPGNRPARRHHPRDQHRIASA